ncbi:DUF6507 family protein [Microbacterium sp. 179-I 3D4 NHS]|uniref:DUF6507 family protein n=1 Tax=Microbacterium sp. 179-I 3D4 NHS TaxID=3142381 RepID=UPI00399FD85A
MNWSVDVEGVRRLVTGIDMVGPDFETAHQAVTTAAESGSGLSVDGRKALSAAWDSFLQERSLVPGKIMHAVASAAGALNEATAAVTAGDAEMTADVESAQRTAEGWGIPSSAAYDPSGWSY